MSQACPVAQEGDFFGISSDFMKKFDNDSITAQEVRGLLKREDQEESKFILALNFMQGLNDSTLPAEEAKRFLRGQHPSIIRKKSLHLRLVKGGRVVLPATDGTQTISKADDVFGWVDNDFANWELDEPADPTPETPVEVHEMVKDGTFDDIFKGIGVDLDLLAMTPHQIKVFCKEHRDLLGKDGYGTFFLMKRKKDGKFFVACVYFAYGGRLKVHVSELAFSRVWLAECAHRFVIPQLGA